MADGEFISRTCSCCKKLKPISEFYLRRDSKDGYNRRCIACVKASQKKYREENPEFHAERNRKYQKENVEKIRESRKRYFQRNRDKVLEWNRNSQRRNADKHRARGIRYYQENREKVLERSNNWKRSNPEKRVKHDSARKAAIKQAAVTWANQAAIRAIYKKARLIGRHVDHIVPLKSKIVCGLHCEANLQILDATSNSSKGNRFWPDMP